MNAKHLFLTVLIGVFSSYVWGDEVIQSTDVINTSTIDLSGMVNNNYNAVSGWSFVSGAQYSASSFYLNTGSEFFGLENGTSLVAKKAGAKVKSITISWLNDDDLNDDEGKATLRVYARNGSEYSTSGSHAASERRHTFTYKDGVTTYDFTSDFENVALFADINYIALFTSISITWEWTNKTQYTVSTGSFNSDYGDVTISPTLAYAGDEITVTMTPKMYQIGLKKTKYSLTSYAFDGMEFDLSCGKYPTYGETGNDSYTAKFPMPARNVTVDATFEYVKKNNSELTIDKSVVTVGSGKDLVIPFTLFDGSGNPIPSYSGTITAVSSDGTILSADAPVKVSDGHYTFTVHGKAMGGATVTVTAQEQAETRESYDDITITVGSREVALVANYGGSYYAMKNSLASYTADAVEVFYDEVNDQYFYKSSTSLADITWNAADPSKKNYIIQNPKNSKYLIFDEGDIDESATSYNWWKNEGIFVIPSGGWYIQCNGSNFSAGNTKANSAGEALISKFGPMSFSTASGASIVDARSLTASSNGTICVPFDVTDLSGAGAKFYKFTGKLLNTTDNTKLAGIAIQQVDALEAGHSYYFEMDGNTSITLTGVNTFTTTADKSATDGFVGCLPTDGVAEGGKIYVPSKTASYSTTSRVNGCYGISGGVLHYVQPNATASAKVYRAYIDASELEVVEAKSVPKRRVIFSADYDDSLEFSTDEDVITGIDELTDPKFINWNEPVYNIMGVQVGKGATGMLIQNGHKFFIQ